MHDATQGGACSLLGVVVELARDLTGVPTVWALAWSGDLEDGTASFRALAGDADGSGAVGLGSPASISRSIVGEVLAQGRPTWSDDARSDARFHASESVHQYALRSVGCLPIGSTGALYLLHPTEPGAFSADAKLKLTALSRLAGTFLDGLHIADPYAEALARRERRRARAMALPGLVGEAPAMQDLFAAVHAFAPMPWPALILGETGTGKEAVARALHTVSNRAKAPFVPVNCAAIPEQLAESMLFGHVKGAFTGADRPAEGLIARVRAGTLFLDEVGELPATVQPKLLRLLQEGTYERVGGSTTERFEGRVVAATHRALDQGEARSGFRADLFHRLGGCILRVPPLRDRRTDVPAIARFLFERAAAQAAAGEVLTLDEAALPGLQRLGWPGNVRELENLLRAAIARALAADQTMVGADLLGVAPFHAPVDLGAAAPPAPVSEPAGPEAAEPEPAAFLLHPDLREATDAFQRAQVREALRRTDGNRTAAAGLLGVSRQWLHRLLGRWDGAP